MSSGKLLDLAHRDIGLPRPSTSTLWAMGGVLAILLLLFHRAVFLGEAFYEWDIHLLWHSQVESFVRVVSSGSWPLWNPWFGFGQPMLADPNSQVFYPLTWLHLIVPPITYHTTFVILHLLFSAAGAYRLGTRWGISPGGSFVAAGVWVLSGPLQSLVYVWNHFTAACWIPWVFWAAERATTDRRLAASLLAGGLVALQLLAGSPDMSVFTMLMVAANTLRRLDWKRPLRGANRRLLGLAAMGLGFAMALSAAQWVPSLELASQSARSALPESRRLLFSVHPVSLSQLALPIYLHELPLHPTLWQTLFQSRNPFLDSLYLGMPVLVLAAAAFSVLRRPHLVLLLLISVAGILLALGSHSPVHGLASQWLPFLQMLRYPVKAIILTAFGCALLSGFGFDAWREPNPRFRALATGACGLAVAANVLAAVASRFGTEQWGPAVFAPSGPGSSYVRILEQTTLRLSLAAGLALILLVLALKQRRRAWRWSAPLVVMLALVDLAVTHRSVNLTAPAEILSFRPEAVDVVASGERSRLYVYDYFDMNKAQYYLHRVEPYDARRLPRDWPFQQQHAYAMRAYLYPPGAAVWAIAGSYDMDFLGLYPKPLDELTRLIRSQEETPIHLRLLRMGAVSHVLALHARGLEDLTPLATLLSAFPEPIWIFRVPEPLPRTYAVSGTRIASGENAARILVDPGFEPDAELILPEGRSQIPRPTFAATSRLIAHDPDRVRIECELNQPGYVVLVDRYDPGWRVAVDGEPAELLRANMAFRAVRVPEGRHLVEFAYRPKSVAIGLAVSSTALLFGLAFALRSLGGG